MYPVHVLVVFGGPQVGSGGYDEIWQVGIRGTLDASETVLADPDGYLASIKTPLNTWWTTGANGMANTFKLGFIKANNIGADGKYIDPVTHRTDYTSPASGPATTYHPPTNAVACSWTTANARGLAHTGRIYLPVAVGITAEAPTNTLPAAVVSATVTAGKALLTLLKAGNTGGSGHFIPSVVSRGHRTGFDVKGNPVYDGPGAMHAITGVRVGSIQDILRRRKSSNPEIYTGSAWP